MHASTTLDLSRVIARKVPARVGPRVQVVFAYEKALRSRAFAKMCLYAAVWWASGLNAAQRR